MGSIVPEEWGLKFAIPLTFLAIIVNDFRKLDHVIVMIISGISSLIFFESGFSKNYKPKLSYGLGLKKITNNALINIEYAIPYAATINEAKIHIKWLTRL